MVNRKTYNLLVIKEIQNRITSLAYQGSTKKQTKINTIKVDSLVGK